MRERVYDSAPASNSASPTYVIHRQVAREGAAEQSQRNIAQTQPDPFLHGQSLNRQTGGKPSLAANSLLQMQRVYGNRYIQRVLEVALQSAGEGEVEPDTEAAIERSRGSGQALEPAARGHMESAFGVNFSGVRIHTGAEAHSLNRAVGAVAFTTGSDIFFRNGAYDPGSSGGRNLLAHELTHVVQQGGASPEEGKVDRFGIQRMCKECEKEKGRRAQTKLVVGAVDDPHEREAEQVAAVVTSASTTSSKSPAGQASDRDSLRRVPSPESSSSAATASQQAGPGLAPAAMDSPSQAESVPALLGSNVQSDFSALSALDAMPEQDSAATQNAAPSQAAAPSDSGSSQIGKLSRQPAPGNTPAPVRLGTTCVIPTSFGRFFQGKAPSGSNFAAETQLVYGVKSGGITVDQDRSASWVNSRQVAVAGARTPGNSKLVADCKKAFAKGNISGFSTTPPTGCDAQAALATPHNASSSADCETVLGAGVDADANAAANLLLRHEQYHVDLGCRIATQGNRMIDKGSSPKGVKAAVVAADNKHQAEYDTASNHGCTQSQQSAWEAKIDDMSTNWL